jgi:hypothetical protein
VSATYWRACLDSHVLGCWSTRERAMQAAKEAALRGEEGKVVQV